jgi:hypothetical protein
MLNKLVCVIAILSFAVGVCFYFSWPPSPEAQKEVSETNAMIKSLDVAIEEQRTTIIEHKTETVRRVVRIRDEVEREMSNLDADGLALAAIYEINLFRSRGAGGSPDTRPARMDIGN